MKIVLVHRESYRDRQRSREHDEALLSLLETEADERKRRILRSLVRLVLPPESTLANLPAPMGFALVQEAFEVMDLRRDDIALHYWTPTGAKYNLLLVNMPDVPYAATSLQLLPTAQDGRLKLTSYLPLNVQREDGRIVGLTTAESTGEREALIVLQFEGGDAGGLGVRETLAAALRVSRDAPALHSRFDRLSSVPVLRHWQELLQWGCSGAFVPFAYRQWVMSTPGGRRENVAERLGIAIPGEEVGNDAPVSLFGDDRARRILSRESPLVFQQTDLPSPLGRLEPLIYLGCREPLPDGSTLEHGFLGLFSARALKEPVFAVSALRQKIVGVLEGLSIAPDSYDFRRLADLFNAFPKLELFCTDERQLHLIARSLLHFLTRPGRLKLLLLASPSPESFVLLGLQPKRLFQEQDVPALESWLLDRLGGVLERSRVVRGGSDYVGLCWTLVPPTDEVHLDLVDLEKGLNRRVQFWEQRYRNLLQRFAGKHRGATLAAQYGMALPPGYRELTPPGLAVRDTLHLERMVEFGVEVLDLWRPTGSPTTAQPVLRLYSLRQRFLDELLPLLENLGLRVADEIQFVIYAQGRKLFIKSFSVCSAAVEPRRFLALKKTLLEALHALLGGRAENDGLNALLLLTGLTWWEIDVFRGYRNYYRQLGARFTPQRIEQSLVRNPGIAVLLHRYFDARFNPELVQVASQDRDEVLMGLRSELAVALNEVVDISEDRILRDLFNLIDATTRTSYYLRRGRNDYFFAFKVSSVGVFNMPTPRPLFEIYVHSVDMEGIHLRGAKVARGGIRWSERPDDFRSEILDLMQTQMIKNAQIVAHGAKGGFILKTPFRSREEGIGLVKDAYATLIRGLLDLTDNFGDAGPFRSPALVTYDEDDPYLVVAADKGTAHLSDTANAIAKEYGFWLGDAFASGGSCGYDHKKLGITARGAWECVTRHFGELGHDIRTQPFAVVGIGSMDGDVFGNGMLHSASIRLLGAFSAKHIFLDPSPDGEFSYRERKRLFNLPGSSWDDYDRKLISPGGGVFERTAKDIPLTPQVRRWLGVRYGSIDGEGLIRVLLTAPVDLLWLGGIGTYIKASGESNEEVGDRANDSVRVNGCELRARVVGEGANLGFTQKGRVEFALTGGMINNDAVDNSGGVDLSDQEVNLKVLMAMLERKGVIAGQQERDEWLERLKDEICCTVISHNRLQSLSISLDRERCTRDGEPFLVVADRLENSGLLDRASEAFPGRKEVVARQQEGLTRPELAVLLLYSKLALKRALLENADFLSAPCLKPFLTGYFPPAVAEHFGWHLYDHPLAREITATAVTNTVINQAGCGFLALVDELDSASLTAAVGTYLCFDEIVEGRSLRARIGNRDGNVSAQCKTQHLLKLEDTLLGFCRWALDRGQRLMPEKGTVSARRIFLRQYLEYVQRSLGEAERTRFQSSAAELEEQGLEPQEAALMALMDHLGDFTELADLAEQLGKNIGEAAEQYDAVAVFLGIERIAPLLDRMVARDHWERRVLMLLRGRMRSKLAGITRAFIQSGQTAPRAFFAARDCDQRLERFHHLHRELTEATQTSIAPFFVLCAELDTLSELCVGKVGEPLMPLDLIAHPYEKS